MKTRLILTIPHSSTHIINDGTINKIMFPKVQADALQCADLYTDVLFDYDNAEKIICPVSRMLVDVERYLDKEEETMASFNRGVFYKVLNDGKTVYRVNTNIDLLDIYTQYHKRLKKTIEFIKKENREPFIVDCHSFNEEPFEFDLCKNKEDRDVDICFGYKDETDLPKNVFEKIELWSKDNNYTYSFNKPYSSPIVCEGCKKYLMIELNKRIYLMKDNITPQPTMYRVQMQIKTLLDSFLEE